MMHQCGGSWTHYRPTADEYFSYLQLLRSCTAPLRLRSCPLHLVFHLAHPDVRVLIGPRRSLHQAVLKLLFGFFKQQKKK
jgi:hypothetical protein